MARININDIAQKAGVSKTAVSFAFNNPQRLPEARVKQILRVAKAMGYNPDPVARTLTTGKTGTIGVLVPQPIPEIIRNPFMPEFLEGVGEICTEASLSLMIVPPIKGSIQRAIVNAAVDGFLTLGLEAYKATMMVLQQRGVPFVTVDSDPIVGFPAVNVDDEDGAQAAMLHVLQAGHRRITILAIRSGKQGRYEQYAGTLRHRMDGYLAALAKFGLTIDKLDVRLMECPSTEQGGVAGFQNAWKGKSHPTAIVAMSDIIAIGVMKAALAAGISVPQELSVAGFDDLPLASLVNPPLTTVAQPLAEKGRLAGELLMKFIRGQRDTAHLRLPTRLVIRNSVQPPSN